MLWGFAIPLPPGNSRHIDGIGGLQIPRLIGRTFFTTDCKSVGTPNGGGTSNLHWNVRSAGYALSLAPDMPVRSAGYAHPPLGVPQRRICPVLR